VRQIQSYIAAYAEPLEYYDTVMAMINSQSDFKQLCATPVFLSYLAEAISDQAVPDLEEHIVEVGDFEEQALDAISASSHTQASFKISEWLVSVDEVTFDEPMDDVTPVEDESEEQEDDNSKDLLSSPPLTIGLLLDRAYQRLFDRESQRRISEIDLIREWKEEVGELALYIDGKRQAERAKVIKQKYLDDIALRWLLSLGVMLRTKYGSWIRFATRLTQTYFAAIFLLPYIELYEEREDDELAKFVKACQEDFLLDVERLLKDISYTPDVDHFFKEELYG
jgi:hypothetical protein